MRQPPKHQSRHNRKALERACEGAAHDEKSADGAENDGVAGPGSVRQLPVGAGVGISAQEENAENGHEEKRVLRKFCQTVSTSKRPVSSQNLPTNVIKLLKEPRAIYTVHIAASRTSAKLLTVKS